MSTGSLLAGYSKRLGGCVAVHSIANTIGGLHHLPHGLVVGVFLPHVLRFLLPGDMTLLAQIAQAMGGHTDGMSTRDAAEVAITHVDRLLEDIEYPTLSELGIKEAEIPRIAQLTMEEAGIGGNPRPMTIEACEAILRSALAETHSSRLSH
jgi:alcohol dehydrogenase class IV